MKERGNNDRWGWRQIRMSWRRWPDCRVFQLKLGGENKMCVDTNRGFTRSVLDWENLLRLFKRKVSAPSFLGLILTGGWPISVYCSSMSSFVFWCCSASFVTPRGRSSGESRRKRHNDGDTASDLWPLTPKDLERRYIKVPNSPSQCSQVKIFYAR